MTTILHYMFSGNSKIIGLALAFLAGVAILFFIVSQGKGNSSSEKSPASWAPSSDESTSFHAVPASASSCEMGQFVTFGRYPQNNGDTPDPIEWLVLDKDDDTALLISRFGMDCKPFHPKPVAVSWRDCDLRKWLNDDFLRCAFSADEQNRIAESTINMGDSLSDNDRGEIRDKLFCLSIEEAENFFETDIARKCQPTVYAVSHNAKPNNCWYWLRSPGGNATGSAFVGGGGSVLSIGVVVSRNDIAVRPALRIKL